MLYVNETQYVNGQIVKERTLVHQPPQQEQEQEFKHILMKPQIPMAFWEFLHDISLFLIVDDKHDLGHFTYYNRNDHYYRFKKSPNHPSPIHHWQIGVVGLVMAQIGGLLSKAMDIKNEFEPKQTVPDKFKKIIDLEPERISYVQKPALPQPPSNNDVYRKLTSAIERI